MAGAQLKGCGEAFLAGLPTWQAIRPRRAALGGWLSLAARDRQTEFRGIA
jgi:hypothetical protein